MKNIFTYILLLITGTTCCSAADYSYDSARGLVFAWEYDDAIGIYTSSGTRIEHWATTVDPNGGTSSFSSYGWSLAGNSTYYLYSPYNNDYYINDCKITSLPISYRGQTQATNDDFSHLTAYDFMMGTGKTTATGADFSLNHVGAVMRIIYQSPAAKTYKLLTIKASEDIFTDSAMMNLKSQSVSAASTASEVSIMLDDINVARGKPLTVNMMIAPADLSSKDITVTLTDTEDQESTFTLTGSKIKAGHIYLVNLNKGKTAETEETARTLATGTLTAPTVTTTSFDFDEESAIATEILNTTLREKDKDSNIYSTTGARLQGKLPKGIYIYKGKKIISK